MSTTNCPNSQRLTAYSHGNLPSDAAEQIADHLEQCPLCEQTVRDLERQGNTLIGLLRAPLAADPHLAEPECRRSLDELQKSGPTLRPESSLSAADPAPLGTIRDYELLEQLGEGGMGTVYKARHRKLKRLVALKVLPTSKLDAAAVARFEREMEAAGKMHHRHIVGATDAGEENGTHFLVMEFVAGRDLAKVIEAHGPLDVADACEIIRQAAAGLQCAHEHGLVHRDIKPSNLMLATQTGSEPIVKILDLGLALLFGTQSPQELTNSGQVMGTLDYMAPEQVADAHRVDARADIYALGATLYKLLTGVAVYHGPAYSSAIQKLNALANVEAPPIQNVRPDLPAELAALVHRMLAKGPAARPQSARETAELLRPFTAGQSLAAIVSDSDLSPPRREVPINAIPMADAAPSAASWNQPATQPHPVAAKRSSAKIWIAAGLGALALLFLIALVPVVWYLSHYQQAVPLEPGIPQLGPSDPAYRLAPNPPAGTVVYAQTTGSASGVIWGTDFYTHDSSVATAAVHAGALKAGEHGVLKITFESPRSFTGSLRNGVSSGSWSSYPYSFRVERSTVQAALLGGNTPTPAASAQTSPDVQVFTVTGTTIGYVWGTDVYSSDSSIPAAAVHAGVLQPGETADIKVTYLAGRDGYIGSTRHGVTSWSFAAWPRSMQFERAGDDAGPAVAVIEPTTEPLALSMSTAGQVHVVRVTGTTVGSIWGSDIYTTDSAVAVAAVHAGVLQAGEAGLVKITVLPGQNGYQATTRNGVTSFTWGTFPASYRLERASSDPPKSSQHP